MDTKYLNMADILLNEPYHGPQCLFCYNGEIEMMICQVSYVTDVLSFTVLNIGTHVMPNREPP